MKDKTRFGNTRSALVQDFAEHLKYSLDTDKFHAGNQDFYKALALTIKDRIIHQWNISRSTQKETKSKRVNYLSLEFLIGRVMNNNIINLGLEKEIKDAMQYLGYDYKELEEMEPDAGLGNGGLGRLAACFLDSLASLDYPAFGYGIRYNYGIFKQNIINGYQVEQPDNWLINENPWEVARPNLNYDVYFGGRVETITENNRYTYNWVPSEIVSATAYDIPIIGYGATTVNTLRLWSAKATSAFNFKEFNEGDYTEAVRDKISAENLSQVLYPNDTLYMGKELRLKQQFLFVTCSLQDIIRRFKKISTNWSEFKDYAAIQLNDTHPSLVIPELMRLLLDKEKLSWDKAWEITTNATAYTNHTLMPEALEKWSLEMLEKILPRHVQIIFEINHRFLAKAVTSFPLQNDKLSKVSIIEESSPKMVRMANLAIIGSHSVNGVAKLHSELLVKSMFPEFNIIMPDKFNNKTNGITQRRWLLAANPGLANLISSAIGDSWITKYDNISKLKKFAKDSSFLDDFNKIKYENKVNASNFLYRESGIKIDPSHLIDTQVKRIHEYKRQFLNALHILVLYQGLKNNTIKNMQPTTFLFGGKAAPGYINAKLIIKFINSISNVINNDKQVNQLLKVHFMPNYRVTMAENIIPATNLSEQISTAGTEASGTGNMKFMINGALTIGTLDGANVEIAEQAGKDNVFIFGHTEDQISKMAENYNPYDFINQHSYIQDVIKLIDSNYFNINEKGIFDSLKASLLGSGRDRYFLFADLPLYKEAHQKARDLYQKDINEWNKKAVINIASSAKFSSDRTISEYANDIWKLKKCKVKKDTDDSSIISGAKLK